MPPDSNQQNDWHRYFAIECNNTAWDLSTSTRTQEQNRQLLDAAHAAAHHWNIVGEESHRMSAMMLLAEAHCLAGCADRAFEYAETMCGYFASKQTDAWELALAHGIFAHAAALTGNENGHKAALSLTHEAFNAITDKQDREIVLETLNHVPGFT